MPNRFKTALQVVFALGVILLAGAACSGIPAAGTPEHSR